MPMYSACGNAALPALGFPIRESTDHRLFSAYPWLIAAVHALHRLLVPRHPPCALHILTVITHSTEVEHAVIPVTLEKLYSFQGPRKRRRRASPSVSQNSTACEAPATRARACVQLRSTLLGPGRSSCCGMQLEADQALQSWRLP
jgi:hypothetical protein